MPEVSEFTSAAPAAGADMGIWKVCITGDCKQLPVPMNWRSFISLGVCDVQDDDPEELKRKVAESKASVDALTRRNAELEQAAADAEATRTAAEAEVQRLKEELKEKLAASQASPDAATKRNAELEQPVALAEAAPTAAEAEVQRLKEAQYVDDRTKTLADQAKRKVLKWYDEGRLSVPREFHGN